MNDGRKKCSSTPEENPETLRITQNKLKINRLKRSPKTNQTQKSDITNCRAETDFKTPIRVPKVGFRSSFTDESPSNDYELQHEIIWDPTSPVTPVRNGRARRRTAVFKSVDISDIASRIAPKNKRPEEAESSLLQWIGDTAVPCTPEIREPRTKPKPTRQNPVDDLLKLAKQFDFNIQQEEANLRPNPLSSAEAMHEDQDLVFDGNEPPASPQSRSEAERPHLGLEDTKTTDIDPLDDLGLIQEMEDDLDLLFDGSTQQLSGGLSQGFSARSPDVAKFAPQCGVNLAASDRADSANTCGVTRVCGASGAVRVCVAAPILGTIKQVGEADDFDDDWNDDDLLDDSLVMEQFSAPQHSSTQKQKKTDHGSANTVYFQNDGDEAKSREARRLNHSRLESIQCGQHWNKTPGNENARQTGFHAKNNSKTQVFPSSKVPSMVPGSHSVSKTYFQPKKPMETQRTLATTSSNSTWKVQSVTKTSFVSRSDASRSVPSATITTMPTFKTNEVTEEKENQPTMEDDVLGDIAADDLDSIFASDDIWDDGVDDDDLFCEACEKVEESMADPEPPPKASVSNPTQQSSHVQSSQHTMGEHERMFVQSSMSNALVYDRSTTGTRASSSTEVLPGAHNTTSRMYKFSQVKSTTRTGSGAYNAARQVSKSSTATTVQSYQRIQDNHQFKKPYNSFNAAPTVSKDVTKAVVMRCSDSEIERKKQQAMERRRLRMLDNQNLQTPV